MWDELGASHSFLVSSLSIKHTYSRLVKTASAHQPTTRTLIIITKKREMNEWVNEAELENQASVHRQNRVKRIGNADRDLVNSPKAINAHGVWQWQWIKIGIGENLYYIYQHSVNYKTVISKNSSAWDPRKEKVLWALVDAVQDMYEGWKLILRRETQKWNKKVILLKWRENEILSMRLCCSGTDVWVSLRYTCLKYFTNNPGISFVPP